MQMPGMSELLDGMEMPPRVKAGSSTAESIFDAVREGRVDALPADRWHAEANAKDEDGLSVLHLAVDGEKVEVVRTLLAANADPNAVDTTDSTPLHFAALLGNAPLVSMLLEAGADSQLKDEDGNTPHALAVAEGHDADLLESLAPRADAPPSS